MQQNSLASYPRPSPPSFPIPIKEAVLLEKNPSVDQQVNAIMRSESNKSDAEDSDEWQRISDLQRRMSLFRNKAVDKWQRRAQVTTGAAAIKGKLHAFNQEDSANKHGILVQVVQVLTELNLIISKADISSDGGWFMDVFNVTDQDGNKVTDDPSC